jgi:nicotinamidase-related amidase
MKTALLLVDIQKDYFPGGRMELVGATRAAERAKEVLEHFRKSALPVIHVQHLAVRPGAKFFLPDTEGAEIHPSVQPLPGEILIQKHYPNSFRRTALLDVLREQGIDHLVISGMMTHMCVDATVRAAFDYGFACTVVCDACASRDVVFEGEAIQAGQVHGAFLAAMGGTYAKLVTARAVTSGELDLV